MPKFKKPKKSSLKKLVLAAGAVALIAGSVPVAKRVVVPGELVTEVLDGDSFKIQNKQTVRLSTLDAPELEFCMGKESKSALSDLILDKKVILRDMETDMYGRIIALVYVDKILVNEYMIKNGLAASTRQGGDEGAKIKAANDFARNNSLGIFSIKCYQIDPPDKKCPIKGNIDDRTKIKEYLPPDCRHYSKAIIEKNMGETWFCSEKEAKKAGFILSNDCYRE